MRFALTSEGVCNLEKIRDQTTPLGTILIPDLIWTLTLDVSPLPLPHPPKSPQPPIARRATQRVDLALTRSGNLFSLLWHQLHQLSSEHPPEPSSVSWCFQEDRHIYFTVWEATLASQEILMVHMGALCWQAQCCHSWHGYPDLRGGRITAACRECKYPQGQWPYFKMRQEARQVFIFHLQLCLPIQIISQSCGSETVLTRTTSFTTVNRTSSSKHWLLKYVFEETNTSLLPR